MIWCSLIAPLGGAFGKMVYMCASFARLTRQGQGWFVLCHCDVHFTQGGARSSTTNGGCVRDMWLSMEDGGSLLLMVQRLRHWRVSFLCVQSGCRYVLAMATRTWHASYVQQQWLAASGSLSLSFFLLQKLSVYFLFLFIYYWKQPFCCFFLGSIEGMSSWNCWSCGHSYEKPELWHHFLCAEAKPLTYNRGNHVSKCTGENHTRFMCFNSVPMSTDGDILNFSIHGLGFTSYIRIYNFLLSLKKAQYNYQNTLGPHT